MTCMLAIVMLALGILPARIAKAQTQTVSIPVVVKGGGIVRIDGSDYVPRADTQQESIAEGWTKLNGSSLLPNETVLTVPDKEEKAFVFQIDPDQLAANTMYSYKIAVVPGTDQKVSYDTTEYILEIYIDQIEGSNLNAVFAQLRNDAPGPDRDRKPAECYFDNVSSEEPTKEDPTKEEPTKPEPTKPEPTKPEPTKPEPTKPDGKADAKTGDTNHIISYVLLGGFSLILLIALIVYVIVRRRNNQ